jgi:DNA-directed RNA polymerase subunit alpha
MPELVDELQLSMRAWNVLSNSRIRTVAQLLALTKSDLLCLPNFGRVTLAELEEELARHGLRLGSLPPPAPPPDWWRATLNELT